MKIMADFLKSLDDHLFESVIALVALVFSALSFRLSKKTFVTDIRPVLVFVWADKTGWKVQNIGAGPALNVVIGSCKENHPWGKPVRIPSLSANGDFSLHWICADDAWGLAAKYHDINGKLYSSICSDDLSEVFTGSKLPDWHKDEIERHWEKSRCR
jgi:hypothetical protein